MHFKIFPSLFEKPQKIRFEHQEEKERIELFLRRHPVTNIPWIVASLIGLALPILTPFIEQFLGTTLLLQIPVQILVGFLVIYYLIILAYIIESFLFWYFNVYIVTNQHIVDINFNSVLSKEVIEVSLDDVESISRKMGGLWHALFVYGDVIIETAAKQQRITFDKVPNPDFVVDVIQDLVSARKLFFEGDKK